MTVHNKLTSVITWRFSSSFAPILGAMAPIAEDPQTAFPPAIIVDILSEKPKRLPIKMAEIITVAIIAII